MVRKHFALFTLMFGLLACNGREEVPILPTISIQQAPALLELHLPDTVRLTIDLADETGLVSLKVQLLYADLTPATEALNFGLSGSSERVSVVYPIGSALLPSGTYYVGLNANGTQGTRNAFVKVQLTGIPPRSTGAVFLSGSGGNTRIYQTDSVLTQVSLKASVACDLRDAIYDAKSASIWFIGTNAQSVYRYDLQTHQATPVFTSLPAIGFPVHTSIHQGPVYLYLGRGQGNVIALNRSATQSWLYNVQEAHYPGMIRFLGDHVMIEIVPVDQSSLKRVQLIHATRLGLIREITVEGQMRGAVRLNADQVLLLVDVNGQGRLFRYTLSLNKLESELSVNTQHYLSVSPVDEGVFALHYADGFRLYDPGATAQSGSFSTGVAGNYSYISYDPLAHRMLALSGTVAHVYALNGSGNGSITLPEPATFGFITRSRD